MQLQGALAHVEEHPPVQGKVAGSRPARTAKPIPVNLRVDSDRNALRVSATVDRFNRLLASGAELAQAHWETPVAATTDAESSRYLLANSAAFLATLSLTWPVLHESAIFLSIRLPFWLSFRLSFRDGHR
jgi:hypothetical protein